MPPATTPEAIRLAVDNGGTFTDVVLETPDARYSAKVLTTKAAPEDGAAVDALVRALEAHVPARLALLTEPLTLAPLTSGLVRRLVDEQGLSEEAARWAVETWAAALGKADGTEPALANRFPAYEHLLAPPRRGWPIRPARCRY